MTTTVSKLNGLFKEVYADALEDAKPKGLHLMSDIEFVSRDQRPGNSFHQPVSLTHEHGFTYAAANTGPVTLNAAISHQTKDASILGTQCYLRSRIDYETAARASSSGRRAFRQALDVVVENMNDSFYKRCEIDCFYGQQGIGVVSAINQTTGVITLTAASFAPGIWGGAENAQLVIHTSQAAASVTHSGTLTVTAVDIHARTVTVTGTTTNVVGTDFIYWSGSRTATAHNVAAGLDALVTASSGTIHGITIGSFSLWKGNVFTISSSTAGNLTFGVVNDAVASAVGKGLDEEVVLYLNPKAWADLLDDEVALRRHYGAGKPKYDVGAEGITFYSQAGTIMIKASRYVKESDGFLISPRLFKRIGATDITFRLPDRGDEFFKHVEDAAAYELRAMSNQALFTRALAKATKIANIVPSATGTAS